MKKSRNASALLFGIDFQVNAAIVLMLNHIKKLSSLKLEGEEDIELKLDDDTSILAQAKAVRQSSSDFSNVRRNLKKALYTLSEAAHRNNTRELIFITNSPDPLNDKDSKSVFYGLTHRAFHTLPPSAKKIIQGYLSNIKCPLDTAKFSIHVLPFETEDDNERLKAVYQCIDRFLGSLDFPQMSPGLGSHLLRIWNYDIFKNGTKRNSKLVLTKKSIIWPLLVVETKSCYIDENFCSKCGIYLYEDIVKSYQALIDYCCERIDFFTKVLYDYNKFEYNGPKAEKIIAFINETWRNYKEEFTINALDEDTRESIIKIILYNIIRRRGLIEQVKQKVNL